MSNPTFNIANPIYIVNKSSDVDSRYGPWSSIQDANNNVNINVRRIGLTVGVSALQTGVVEYWYKNGTQDGDLVLKQTGGTVQPQDIIPTVTNYLSTNNVLVSSLNIFDRLVVDNQLYYTTDNRVTQLSALSGNYDEGQFLGKVKLSQNNTRLINVGNTWTAKEPTGFFYDIAISSDGKYQTTVSFDNGLIYISNDYGNTWNANNSVGFQSWAKVAMSSDGKYQTATVYGGKIYISRDYGNTWTEKLTTSYWTGVAMSSDGKYQTVLNQTSNDSIYISEDYGNTWTAISVSNADWQDVAMSSDGKYQTAVAVNSQLYISNNYGYTWTAKESNREWLDVAMSSDGKYQTAIESSGYYISNDYGNTWKSPENFNIWSAVAMSSDGKRQTLFGGGYIFVSNDYGNTGYYDFFANGAIIFGVDMSSDGKYQTAVGFDKIYTSVADELIDGSLTVTNNLSTENFGTADQWYSSYTTVQSNSANWGISNNIDGGSSTSVYLLNQNINGGSSTSVYFLNQNINGGSSNTL